MDMMDLPTLAYMISADTKTVSDNYTLCLDDGPSIMEHNRNMKFSDEGGNNYAKTKTDITQCKLYPFVDIFRLNLVVSQAGTEYTVKNILY